MYTRFFGLTEKPFAITPDPRYLYLSERHAEALAHLLYGIDEAGGFVQLTGEVGTGKTTTVRGLLAELPEHADIALILNPRLSPLEFLATICDELHIDVPASARQSIKEIVDRLNVFLLAAHGSGRRVVVIVDEAQQLSADVLEQVRLLTNLETATTKLLQIILVGQPELRELLERNDLRQLAQRITGRYHLDPLSEDESAAYIRHRLRVAGATGDIFTPSALRTAHQRTGGVPRLLNVVADRALLGAYTRESRIVTPDLVRAAAREIGNPHRIGRAHARILISVGALIAVVAIGGVLLMRHSPLWAPRPAVVAATPRPAPAAAAVRSLRLVDFLTAHADETDTAAAFGTLFGLWQTPLDTNAAAAPACEQASLAGLECHADKASFAELRLYNRPAILTLALPDGTTRQVVLTTLEDQTAELRAGAATLRVDLHELEPLWYGDYLILWKPPTSPSGLIRPGSRGPEVSWLKQRLGDEAANGRVDDFYDASLSRAIATFQREHHLASDGLAGTRTQRVLDGAYRQAEGPHLHGGVL
jgi:general secretion pathway protein A